MQSSCNYHCFRHVTCALFSPVPAPWQQMTTSTSNGTQTGFNTTIISKPRAVLHLQVVLAFTTLSASLNYYLNDSSVIDVDSLTIKKKRTRFIILFSLSKPSCTSHKWDTVKQNHHPFWQSLRNSFQSLHTVQTLGIFKHSIAWHVSWPLLEIKIHWLLSGWSLPWGRSCCSWGGMAEDLISDVRSCLGAHISSGGCASSSTKLSDSRRESHVSSTQWPCKSSKGKTMSVLLHAKHYQNVPQWKLWLAGSDGHTECQGTGSSLSIPQLPRLSTPSPISM